MEHENEFFGTLLIVSFDLLIAFFIYVLLKSTVPSLLSVAISLIGGAVAVWATTKLVRYWIKRFRK